MVKRRSTSKRKYSTRSRSSYKKRSYKKRSSKTRKTSSRKKRSRSRKRKCQSSRPVTWKPQKSNNAPLCKPSNNNPCANPCNNRAEWLKLAIKNNYLLTWSKLLSALSRCDMGSGICQPFGGISPPDSNIANFQKQFKPKVSIVIGLGNVGGVDSASAYTLAVVELSFNNAVAAPPSTATIKGRGLAGENRGKALTSVTADKGELAFGDGEPVEYPIVVGGVQRTSGSGLFDQLVEINGEAVILAQEFCKMPAWPAAKSDKDKKQDKLMKVFGPGCCLPISSSLGSGGDLPIMRTTIPPGSVFDQMMLDDCRAPVMKIGVGATLPSQVQRTLSWEKNPLKPEISKKFFLDRNKSLTEGEEKKKFDKFKVIFNKEITCGQNLLEQLLVNTIGDGTSIGFFGSVDNNVDGLGGTADPQGAKVIA